MKPLLIREFKNAKKPLLISIAILLVTVVAFTYVRIIEEDMASLNSLYWVPLIASVSMMYRSLLTDDNSKVNNHLRLVPRSASQVVGAKFILHNIFCLLAFVVIIFYISVFSMMFPLWHIPLDSGVILTALIISMLTINGCLMAFYRFGMVNLQYYFMGSMVLMPFLLKFMFQTAVNSVIFGITSFLIITVGSSLFFMIACKAFRKNT